MAKIIFADEPYDWKADEFIRRIFNAESYLESKGADRSKATWIKPLVIGILFCLLLVGSLAILSGVGLVWR